MIGQPEVIQRLTREQAFTLVVVGAVDRDAILAAAGGTFGRFPRIASPRPPAPPVTASSDERIEITRPTSHAYLALGWLAPRIDHADAPAVDLVVSVLGQSRSSRLIHALRDRLGVVNTIASGYSALEGAGLGPRRPFCRKSSVSARPA